MWLMIGILGVIAVVWVIVGNIGGGNSPVDWARDYTQETINDIHDRYWGDRD